MFRPEGTPLPPLRQAPGANPSERVDFGSILAVFGPIRGRWPKTSIKDQKSAPKSTLKMKFSIDSGSYTDMQSPAEFSPKENPILQYRHRIVDTDTIADAVFRTPLSEKNCGVTR